jgi:hypothetical protein
MNVGYTRLNDPPSGDGGYVKSFRKLAFARVATAARRWIKDGYTQLNDPPSGDGGYVKSFRKLAFAR